MKERSAMNPQNSAHSPENCLAVIDPLLREILRRGGFALSFAICPVTGADPAEYVVEFTGEDAGLLLEKNGALLDALEHVVLKAARVTEELLGRITLDCNDWRSLRTEELKLTAQIAAERVAETGEPFVLSPMSPRERRIIHMALKDRPGLRTASEGAGAERRVVILPGSPPKR